MPAHRLSEAGCLKEMSVKHKAEVRKSSDSMDEAALVDLLVEAERLIAAKEIESRRLLRRIRAALFRQYE
jgi:hypothetical protein